MPFEITFLVGGDPGEFHGLYSPWGCEESDMTEQLSLRVLPGLEGMILGCSWK